jgi:hypothetical protein
MASTNSILAYQIEENIWTAAQQHGTIIVNRPTQSATTTLIQRMHKYRQLHRKTSADQQTSYLDNFIISKLTPTSFRVGPRVFDGTVTTVDGTPIDLDQIQRENADLLIQQIAPDLNPFNPDRPLRLTDD